MPSDPTAEQAEVRRKGRQRLVGAVVLALLAVVFVPMVLDPEPRRERPEPSLAIPDKRAPAAPSPLPAAAAAKPAEPAKSAEGAPADPKAAEAPKDPAPKAEPAPETAVVKTVEPKSAEFKSAPKPAPEAPRAAPKAEPKSEPAAPRLEGFAVQVGAFRDETKLQAARDKLKAARLAHYTERIGADGGALTRLRAGPYPTREAADKAAAAIRKAGIAEGQVVPLP